MPAVRAELAHQRPGADLVARGRRAARQRRSSRESRSPASTSSTAPARAARAARRPRRLRLASVAANLGAASHDRPTLHARARSQASIPQDTAIRRVLANSSLRHARGSRGQARFWSGLGDSARWTPPDHPIPDLPLPTPRPLSIRRPPPPPSPPPPLPPPPSPPRFVDITPARLAAERSPPPPPPAGSRRSDRMSITSNGKPAVRSAGGRSVQRSPRRSTRGG